MVRRTAREVELDWRRDARGLGEAGVAALLASAQAEIGGAPLTGIGFVVDGRQMLAAAREVERMVLGSQTTLFVGFQRGPRLDCERARYERLTASGVRVVAFGVDPPPAPVAGVAWVDLPLDVDALVNQWFLVTMAPRPVALVGFETSPPERFGHGGAGRPGRTFSGFATDDVRLVGRLVDHVAAVAGEAGAPPSDR